MLCWENRVPEALSVGVTILYLVTEAVIVTT